MLMLIISLWIVWLFSGFEYESFKDFTIFFIPQELPSEPRTALLFCSYNLYEMTVSVPSKSVAGNTRYPRAAKLEKVKAVDYLQRVLPSSCQITGIIADGIVGQCSLFSSVLSF